MRSNCSIGCALTLALAGWIVGCSDDGAGTPDAMGMADAASDADTGTTSDATPDGSSSDSATTSDASDASADGDAGGGAGCEGSSALFCEDFEALAAGEAMSARWDTTTNGALTIDGTHAMGAQALHVHTDDNGYGFLRLAFAPPGNSYFGRMMLWVDAFPSAPDWAHYTLVEQTGDGSTERVRPVGGQYVPGEGAAFWGIGADGGPTGDWTNWRTSAPSESGRWVCVEWEMDATDNHIRLTLDGVANDDLVVDTTNHGGNDVDFIFPTWTTLRIGWQLYQGGATPSAFDVWIDDIVLDTTRVGC